MNVGGIFVVISLSTELQDAGHTGEVSNKKRLQLCKT